MHTNYKWQQAIRKILLKINICCINVMEARYLNEKLNELINSCDNIQAEHFLLNEKPISAIIPHHSQESLDFLMNRSK